MDAFVPTVFELWQWTGADACALPLESDWQVLVGNEALRELLCLRERQPGLPLEFYRDQVDGVECCAVVLIEGRPAAVIWAYDWRHKGHFLRLAQGEAEVRGLYSLPEWRGRGVGTVVTQTMCQYLSERGYTQLYAIIHSRNFSSLRVFRKASFEKLVDFKRAALFGPRYSTTERTTVAPFEPLWRFLREGRGPKSTDIRVSREEPLATAEARETTIAMSKKVQDRRARRIR